MRILLSSASLLAGLLTLSTLSLAQAEEVPGQVLDAATVASFGRGQCAGGG